MRLLSVKKWKAVLRPQEAYFLFPFIFIHAQSKKSQDVLCLFVPAWSENVFQTKLNQNVTLLGSWRPSPSAGQQCQCGGGCCSRPEPGRDHEWDEAEIWNLGPEEPSRGQRTVWETGNSRVWTDAQQVLQERANVFFLFSVLLSFLFPLLFLPSFLPSSFFAHFSQFLGF